MNAAAAQSVPATGVALRYAAVRAATLALAAPLSPEDCQMQSMADASPVKWHLAHTSWFFETFLLSALPGYRVFDPAFAVLFNSYYVSVGNRHPRAERGLITRPSLAEVFAYRAHVDAAMAVLLDGPCATDLVELGLQHEQQHQELILMDVLHAFSLNPNAPVYAPTRHAPDADGPASWLAVPGGIHEIGHDGNGFAFDNEGARHRVWIDAFEIADRLVTAGEYAAFIADGGYRRPELWLSDGWTAVEEGGWSAPLYWREADGGWSLFSLAGEQPLDPDAAVINLSFYEADAFARWAGGRLPTEAEWEVAATTFVLRQQDNTAWQWTGSAYLPYPGFRQAEGAVGEYNGKFMINQMVLRGGASITPDGHSRPTYRNFFPPAARWAFSGIRLARDV